MLLEAFPDKERAGCGWTLALACAPGYAAALTVHFVVGYTDGWHLAPAYVAVALYFCGLILSYPYLCDWNPNRG